MNRIPRSILTAAAAGVLVISLTQRADAISPSVLMFYGGNLPTPVFVTGADANLFGNLLTASNVAAQDIAGRTYIKVALFWGTQANPTGRGVPLNQLKPEMAWQHGKYYAASGGKPAILLTTEIHNKKEGRAPDYSAEAPYPWGGALTPAAAAAAQAALSPTKTGR